VLLILKKVFKRSDLIIGSKDLRSKDATSRFKHENKKKAFVFLAK
jgi:hypothetical protein